MTLLQHCENLYHFLSPLALLDGICSCCSLQPASKSVEFTVPYTNKCPLSTWTQNCLCVQGCDRALG